MQNQKPEKREGFAPLPAAGPACASRSLKYNTVAEVQRTERGAGGVTLPRPRGRAGGGRRGATKEGGDAGTDAGAPSTKVRDRWRDQSRTGPKAGRCGLRARCACARGRWQRMPTSRLEQERGTPEPAMSKPALRTANWCALEVNSGRAGCLPCLNISGDVEVSEDSTEPFLCEIVTGDVEPGNLLLNLKDVGRDGSALGAEMRAVRFRKVEVRQRYQSVTIMHAGAPIATVGVTRAQ